VKEFCSKPHEEAVTPPTHTSRNYFVTFQTQSNIYTKGITVTTLRVVKAVNTRYSVGEEVSLFAAASRPILQLASGAEQSLPSRADRQEKLQLYLHQKATRHSGLQCQSRTFSLHTVPLRRYLPYLLPHKTHFYPISNVFFRT
jgi:hypothetical protein